MESIGAAASSRRPRLTDASGWKREERDVAEDLRQIELLFEEMDTRRRVLKGMLEFLRDIHSDSELKDEVDRLQEHDFSVYTSSDLSSLLESRGAIEKLTADGTPYADSAEAEPEIVEVDGVERYKPVAGVPVYWATTAAGLEYLEKNDATKHFADLIKDDEAFVGLYRHILAMCSAEEGCTIAQIIAQIDASPLLAGSHRSAPYFVEKLERCDALRWEGCWRTTEAGARCLRSLAQVGGVGDSGNGEGRE